MKIVKIENLDGVKNYDVYYEIGNDFFTRCHNCGAVLKIDYHMTKYDLLNEQPGEKGYFCNVECRREYLNAEARSNPASGADEIDPASTCGGFVQFGGRVKDEE